MVADAGNGAMGGGTNQEPSLARHHIYQALYKANEQIEHRHGVASPPRLQQGRPAPASSTDQRLAY